MKIYKQTPIYFIRLQIAKQLEKTIYITLYETTVKEVEEMIKAIVVEQNPSPFAEGHKTTVNIREATGGTNGKSKSISFRGITPLK